VASDVLDVLGGHPREVGPHRGGRESRGCGVSERLPVLFRAVTPEAASEMAKAWARAEGLRIRTVASIRRRDDLPAWCADHDPYVTVYPFEVTLVVAGPVSEQLRLPVLA
jgi:hypothetical protein